MSPEFSTDPLPKFGLGVQDISVPDLSNAGVAALLAALYANRFLVLKTGGLTRAEFVRFARRIGEPIQLSADGDYPEIAEMSNIGSDTRQYGRGAAHWHTDQSFRKRRSSATLLYSVQVPVSGGETHFCNMVAAYDALSEKQQQQIENLVVAHRHGVSVAARPGDHIPIPPKGWDQRRTVYHPLVRQHPVTGQKTLYAVTGTSQGIEGMADEAGEALLRTLSDHTFQDQFVTAHWYAVNDLVIWDNPTTMHRASPISAATGPDDTRIVHRISLRDMLEPASS